MASYPVAGSSRLLHSSSTEMKRGFTRVKPLSFSKMRLELSGARHHQRTNDWQAAQNCAP
jgi:hypothetical protein